LQEVARAWLLVRLSKTSCKGYFLRKLKSVGKI
jgi:hypothetical protein